MKTLKRFFFIVILGGIALIAQAYEVTPTDCAHQHYDEQVKRYNAQMVAAQEMGLHDLANKSSIAKKKAQANAATCAAIAPQNATPHPNQSSTPSP